VRKSKQIFLSLDLYSSQYSAVLMSELLLEINLTLKVYKLEKSSSICRGG